MCGHSSRRRVTADAHQRPTRRFRHLLEPPVAHRTGTPRRPVLKALARPSLFGLAPCGVYPARRFTAAAVRSYRTFSPLPQQGTCRPGMPERVSGFPSEKGVAEAVCFLWHWPSVSLDAHVPDVIRHTALRSSDFPPPKHLRTPAATAQLSCWFHSTLDCAQPELGPSLRASRIAAICRLNSGASVKTTPQTVTGLTEA